MTSHTVSETTAASIIAQEVKASPEQVGEALALLLARGAATSSPKVLFAKEVEKKARLSAPTIYRMQQAGLFPKYFKYSPRKNALTVEVFAEWEADPQGWAKRNLDQARPA